MIPTYSGVLSVIKKALWELIEKYRGVGKSLQNLVEGQERIRATIEWRWNLEREVRKEESRDEEKGSEDSPRESQKEGTLLSAFC